MARPQNPRRVVDGVTEKLCKSCNDWHPETAEYFFRQGKGFESTCKRSRSAQSEGTKQRRQTPVSVAKTALQGCIEAARVLDALTMGWGRKRWT